jgi:predicted acyl esterase
MTDTDARASSEAAGTPTATFPGLTIDKDVDIPLRDGSVVRADVFRPDDGEPAPVIMTMGPYPKDIHFRQWMVQSPDFYDRLPERGPLMHWETVNPEWWVPHHYVVIRVDERGTGRSEGQFRSLGRAEANDFYDCIEWAGAQPWCTGRVAVMGISYFAINSWRVAALQPPSLAAIVPWEGAVDAYRDIQRHGGIFSNGFTSAWAAHTTNIDEEPPAPPEELTSLLAGANPVLADIQVPLLSVGNWGGVGLHLRGNVEGYLGAGSEHKRLRIHSGDHITPFYALEGRLLQLRFLEQWLKDVDTGITREPPIQLAIRRSRTDHDWRYEYEWPLARTRWTEYHLDADPDTGALTTDPPESESTATYLASASEREALVRFETAPVDEETEITGPVALHAWVSTTATDADLFVVLRNIGPDDDEVTFQGSIPGATKLAAAYGWLRLSHRRLDPEASMPYRPVHHHTDLQPVEPGEVVEVDVEIWPTSVVLAPGHRLVLEIRAHDDPNVAPFLHSHSGDRRCEGTVTIHTGPDHDSYLLLPVIPPRA